MIKFLKRDSNTWEDCWSAISCRYGSRDCQSTNGETWQYMGTVVKGTTALHQFRHRELPSTGLRTMREFLDSYRERDYEEPKEASK